MASAIYSTDRPIVCREKIGRDDDLSVVADIIHGFASDDPVARQQAAVKADRLMQQDDSEEKRSSAAGGTVTETKLKMNSEIKVCQTEDGGDVERDNGTGKTSAKHREDDHKGHGDQVGSLNIAHFLKDLTISDIQRRKLTRSQRKQKSDELRKEGNLSFTNKDYPKAVAFYSQAIDLTRDSTYLYTNRALAHIRLGSYEDAVSDCDRAIFIAEFSLKARLYKAKALFLQGEIDQSLACLQEARDALPCHQPAIDHCEQHLFGAVQPQDQSHNDAFFHEKFMRLAAQFDVAQMETFFVEKYNCV